MTDTAAAIDIVNLPEVDGLAFACKLDGNGGATLGGWADVPEWQASGIHHWVHLDAGSQQAQRWLREDSGLTPVTVEAMLAEDSRPRAFFGKRGTIAILRGVNTNLGEDPEDMVSLRMWSDGVRVITLRQQRLMTPRDILAKLIQEAAGPEDAPQLFERLINRLTERVGVVVNGFDDRLDLFEIDLSNLAPTEARQQLQKIRQDIVVLRRYLAPQREAVATIYAEPPPWLDEFSRLRLREISNRVLQFIEILDAARDRAVVLEDAAANQMAERMNRNMYVISVMAAIFLPLGFVTGLLGINVGGMPGVENSAAFWITCVGVLVILGLELALFRMLKWI